MEAPLWRMMRPADVITIGNAMVGLVAIYVAQYDLALAAWFVLLGILLDGADGAVARLGGGGGPLGKTLDNLADGITFGAAPVVLLWSAADGNWLLLLAGVAVGAVVLLRLARFALDERAAFVGLSSPGGAVLVAGAVLAERGTSELVAAALLGAFLMASRMSLPKLRGAYGATGVAFIGATLATWHWSPAYGPAAALAMMAALLVYLVLGPWAVKRQAHN